MIKSRKQLIYKTLESTLGPRMNNKFSNGEIKELLSFLPHWELKEVMTLCRIAHGIYSFSPLNNETEKEEQHVVELQKEVEVNSKNSVDFTVIKKAEFVRENYIPQKNINYVPFGFYKQLKTILETNLFFPCYITGPSGLGKNLTISEVCAVLKKPMILYSVTEETSDANLLGCWTLDSGNTVWKEGPVVTAAKHGLVLVLDEIDLATPKIMCLQSILNGDKIYVEATGELITPKPGFNIIATGNTKGFGESTIHIGTQALNEAFLERFKIMFEHSFPTKSILDKIIQKKFANLQLSSDDDKRFAECLTSFIDHIAVAYKSESIDYFISNRRLSSIIETYQIFKDKTLSLTLGLSRFPKPIIQAFLSVYSKIDSEFDNKVTEILDCDLYKENYRIDR